MNIIAKITLLLIGIYFVLFVSMTKVKDKPSLLVGKIIPVASGICIIFYIIFILFVEVKQ